MVRRCSSGDAEICRDHQQPESRRARGRGASECRAERRAARRASARTPTIDRLPRTRRRGRRKTARRPRDCGKRDSGGHAEAIRGCSRKVFAARRRHDGRPRAAGAQHARQHLAEAAASVDGTARTRLAPLGALGAATKMAAAANANPNPAPGPTPPPSGTPTLVGHWRSTTISFDSPRDEHFVMRADGTAETWIVTASGRTPVTRGRWSTKGTTLSVAWEDGRQWGRPFTFYQGQLVFPNVPNHVSSGKR